MAFIRGNHMLILLISEMPISYHMSNNHMNCTLMSYHDWFSTLFLSI